MEEFLDIKSCYLLFLWCVYDQQENEIIKKATEKSLFLL
jgi:hypothetical protein